MGYLVMSVPLDTSLTQLLRLAYQLSLFNALEIGFWSTGNANVIRQALIFLVNVRNVLMELIRILRLKYVCHVLMIV